MGPNVVVIVSDSLRQDHVSFYAAGSPRARTPHIDSLLRDSVAFENMYPQGLPTIPVRTEWVTGAGTLASRAWQPLAATDVHCAEILRREGYLTALVTDMYHYFKPGMNFHRGYAVWRLVRGQEYDAWRSEPPRVRRVEDHWKDCFPESWRAYVEAVCRNLDGCRRAADFPCSKTFDEAIGWLEANRQAFQIGPSGKTSGSRRPFFLWVETFDPHEPWTPPEEFDTYGDPAYKGKDFILPPGHEASRWFTQEEIARIRSLYAGEAAYVDAMVGRLLSALRDLGLYDECLVFFMADHGHPLAEHGKFLKGADRMYSELLKVPFGIKLPHGELAGRRVRELAQFPDFLPTLLDACGLARDLPALQGRSLLPLARGDVEGHRDAVICGYHDGADRCIRDGTWSLVLRPPGQPDELYNLVEDPAETRNMIDEHPEEAKRLGALFGAAFMVQRREVRGLQGTYEVAHTSIG